MTEAQAGAARYYGEQLATERKLPRRGGLALAAQRSITDPDYFHRLGLGAMGPTPEARAARGLLLSDLGIAARRLKGARRRGNAEAVRRYREAETRARRALERYDAKIAALVAAQ